MWVELSLGGRSMACAGASETSAGRAWFCWCWCCACWRAVAVAAADAVGAGPVGTAVIAVDVVAVVAAVDALRRRFFLPKGHGGMAKTRRGCVDWTAAYATLDDE